MPSSALPSGAVPSSTPPSPTASSTAAPSTAAPSSPGRLTASVVIPVRDDAALLGRCLAALAAQSVAPLEVIVVDNASGDDSAAVAARFGARVLVEPRVGIPSAASTGYDAARGDVILRLDADSRPPVDWIERMLGALAADPHLAAVTGPGAFIGLHGWRARFARAVYMDAYFTLVGAALAHPPLFGSNFAVRRSAWLAVAPVVHRHDREIHDDIDLSVHLGRRHRIALDRSIVVPISSRPFADPRSFGRRLVRALRSLGIHGLHDAAPARWRRRIRSAWAARAAG